MNTSRDITSAPSTTVLRGFDEVKPNGLAQTLQKPEASSDTAQVLHVSPDGQQRSLDQIEHDFMHCLCDANSGPAGNHA
jgi:hypothetical protein